MRRALLGLVIVLVVVLAWMSVRTGEPGAVTEIPEPRSPATQASPTSPVSREAPLYLRHATWATISGQVRDELGRPISGATVCAAGASRLLDRRDSERRSCVISEIDGHYQIAGLLPVPHAVHASAPRFVPASHRVRRDRLASQLVPLRAGHETTDIDVVLRGGGVELRGVVFDLAGGAVEGAMVSVAEAHALSTSDGDFSLWVAPGPVYVTATADGYADTAQPGVAPGQRFTLRLTPESVLVGRVVRAADHTPLADASVFARAAGAWAGVGPAITDADGKFRIEGLLPGSYQLEARHDEAYGMASESAVLGLGETSTPIEISAHPAYLVEGTVEFGPAEPCPGGRVRLSQRSGNSRGSAIDPDGVAHVQGVLPGSYDVQVECHGAVALPEYAAIVVTDRPVRGQRWLVERGLAIRGVALLASGEPALDLFVRAEPVPDPTAPRARTSSEVLGKSEADGSFALAGLLPGRYRLRAGSDELPEPERPVEVELRAGHDVDDVRVVLPATGELRGTVKDRDGAAVKAVEVQLSGARPGPSARTADDGSFRLAHVPAGAYRATVRADQQALRSPDASDAQGVPVQIRVGAVAEVQLVVVSRRGQIRGRVLDSAGGPVADAFIEPMREPDGPHHPGAALESVRDGDFFGETAARRLTDHDGRFELSDLREGTYTLLARRRGGGEGTLERVAVGSDVELRIAEPAQLAGRVRIAGRDAPREFRVDVYAAATGFRASDRFFRTGGVFRFPEVPAGAYKLTIEAPEGTSTVEASVAEGDRADLQVELAPRVTVRGQVVDLETGAGVPGMQVAIAPRGQRMITTSLDRASGAEVTDEQGRFELERVGAGPASMTVIPRDMVGNGYPFTGLAIVVHGAGAVFELPPVRLARLRIAEGEASGDLGFTTGKALAVTTLRPGGPAARAGLRVGDEIVSVDGHAVTGDAAHLFFTLTRVRPGTRLQLGLARGGSVELSADPAR